MNFLLMVFMATVAITTGAPQRPREYWGRCEDRIPRLCSSELQAHHCYLEHNRDLCCHTCAGHHNGDMYCPYGDHYTNIVRRDANGVNTTYDCSGYIGFYGRHHCSEREFRSYCCQSCKA